MSIDLPSARNLFLLGMAGCSGCPDEDSRPAVEDMPAIEEKMEASLQTPADIEAAITQFIDRMGQGLGEQVAKELQLTFQQGTTPSVPAMDCKHTIYEVTTGGIAAEPAPLTTEKGISFQELHTMCMPPMEGLTTCDIMMARYDGQTFQDGFTVSAICIPDEIDPANLASLKANIEGKGGQVDNLNLAPVIEALPNKGTLTEKLSDGSDQVTFALETDFGIIFK